MYHGLQNLTKCLLAVPKAELDQRVGEYIKRKQAQTKATQRRRTSSGKFGKFIAS